MPSPSCERTAPSPAIAVTGRAGVCCGKCLSCCRQDILLFVTLYHTSLRTLPGVVFVMSDLNKFTSSATLASTRLSRCMLHMYTLQGQLHVEVMQPWSKQNYAVEPAYDSHLWASHNWPLQRGRLQWFSAMLVLFWGQRGWLFERGQCVIQ